MLLASLPVSAIAILQQAHVAGLPAILAGLTDSQDYANNLGVSRATGPFAIWHDLGSYLFVVILLGVAILVRGPSRVIGRRLLIVALVLAVIALIETVSFTPIAGAVIGALLLARNTGSTDGGSRASSPSARSPRCCPCHCSQAATRSSSGASPPRLSDRSSPTTSTSASRCGTASSALSWRGTSRPATDRTCRRTSASRTPSRST